MSAISIIDRKLDFLGDRIREGFTGITSAILDRVLHHAETVVIEGKSFLIKDQTEPPN